MVVCIEQVCLVLLVSYDTQMQVDMVARSRVEFRGTLHALKQIHSHIISFSTVSDFLALFEKRRRLLV